MQQELQGVQAFIKIVDTGSFTKAAKFLNISQPALTRRIKKLENSLGVELFERSTRKVILTSIGRDFLPKAINLLDYFNHSILSIQKIVNYQSGSIAISCIPTTASYFLPKVIRQYNQKYPNIRIRILEYSSNECLESVVSGQSDIGLNMNYARNPDIKFIQLITEPFVLICHKSHPLAKKSILSWKQLKNYPLIGVRHSSGNRSLIEQYLKNIDWKPNWFYEVRHLSSSLGLVEEGLGIAAVPKSALPQKHKNNLITIPLVNPTIYRQLGIIRHKKRTMSPAVLLFKDLLLEQWKIKDNSV